MEKRNDNENYQVEFSEINELSIDGIIFKHKNIHKETWGSVGGKYRNGKIGYKM